MGSQALALLGSNSSLDTKGSLLALGFDADARVIAAATQTARLNGLVSCVSWLSSHASKIQWT
eukprot:1556521-Amphidinium_carterae.1